MAYWAVVRIKPNCERKALHFLGLAGFETYAPRLRVRRTGRRVEPVPFLFPGYTFVAIVLQWTAARYVPGVIDIVKNGIEPARVPDHIIAEIKSRECNGLIELPSPLKRGDPVRVLRGPFCDRLALYDGQPSQERVAVLLSLLGGHHRVTLPAGDVEPVDRG